MHAPKEFLSSLIEYRYLQAISIVHQQGGKTIELRATVSLAHLWRQQGKRAFIREALTPLYHWFTEGHTTADLQDAKLALDRV